MRTAIEQSLDEILRCPKQELGRNFYARLFAACPEARPFFEKIELRVQANILVNSLHVIVSHDVYGYPAAHQFLMLTGARHHERGIPPELFPVFRDCLLQTIAEFYGDRWTESLSTEWRRALDTASAVMLQGYRLTPAY